MTNVTRALPMTLAHELNTGKHEELTKLYHHFSPLANTIKNYLLKELHLTGKIKNRPNIKHLNSKGLSERYKYEILTNVIGNIRAYKTDIENRVKEIAKTSCDTKQYRLIYRAVAFGHCFGPHKKILFSYTDLPDTTLEDAEQAVETARTISRHLRSKWKLKAPKGSFTLGAKVVKIDFEPNTKHNAVIRLSSLTPRKQIILPIHIPEYSFDRAEEFTGAIQLDARDNKVKLRIIGDVGKADYETSGTVVGLDVGAVTPIATSDGDLLGREFWGKVKHYDKLMLRAGKGVHASGLKGPWESTRWQKLNQRLRDYVENEMRRILKNYILREKPAVIVVEDLLNTFAPTKDQLSRRLRRLFRKVGRGIFTKALSEYAEEYGFEVIAVNAWYTSKGHSACGYQSSKNRVQQSSFVCQSCGKKLHADVHGAREVLERCSVKGLSKEYGSSTHTGGRQKALDYLALREQEHYLFQQDHWYQFQGQSRLESRGMRLAPTS